MRALSGITTLPLHYVIQLEFHQKRALHIIYGDQIKGMPYFYTLPLADLECLNYRRTNLSKCFFKKLRSTNSCLRSVLPPERDAEVLSKLRNPLKYPVPYTRTKTY